MFLKTTFCHQSTSQIEFSKYLAWRWQAKVHQTLLSLHSSPVHILPGPLGNTSFSTPTSKISLGNWTQSAQGAGEALGIHLLICNPHPSVLQATPASNVLRAHVISPVTGADSTLTWMCLRISAPQKPQLKTQWLWGGGLNKKLNSGHLLCSDTALHPWNTYNKYYKHIRACQNKAK